MEVIDRYTFKDDRRSIWAEYAEKLTLLTGILESNEKILMDLYFKHNVSVYQLSLLSGRSQKEVRNQIKRLVRELNQGHYPILYQNRDHFGSEKLKVAYDHYLLGLGYRLIAEKRQLPVRVVRRMVRSIDKWVSRHKGKKYRIQAKPMLSPLRKQDPEFMRHRKSECLLSQA
jgi:hypothetical protein